MQIILSPAKIMDWNPCNKTQASHTPYFEAETCEVMAALAQLGMDDIAQLMSTNPKLTASTYYNTQNFTNPDTPAKPALYTYNGEAYHGLDAASLSHSEVEYLQGHLFILSAVYGALRPLHPIRPHRLDMEHKLEVAHHKDLYAYWTPRLGPLLAQALLANDKLLVNLCSKEYFKAVDRRMLPAETQVVTPLFLQDTPKGYRQTVVYAKKARGMMVRYMAQQQPGSIDDLKGFDMEGYYYNEELSDQSNPLDQTLVFVR